MIFSNFQTNSNLIQFDFWSIFHVIWDMLWWQDLSWRIFNVQTTPTWPSVEILLYCGQPFMWIGTFMTSYDIIEAKRISANVTIGPFICLYVWALVTRVGKIIVVVHSSGCHCLGDHTLLQVRASTVARASGNTWWGVSWSQGIEQSGSIVYLVVL